MQIPEFVQKESVVDIRLEESAQSNPNGDRGSASKQKEESVKNKTPNKNIPKKVPEARSDLSTENKIKKEV